MKRITFILAMMMVSSMACFAQNKTLESFTKHFSSSAAFSYAIVNKHEVLLVSHEVFGQDDKTNLKAVATTIFTLDPQGKIVALGSIRSQGTLYPISLLNDKLAVAGHEFVKIYSIRDETSDDIKATTLPELTLDSYTEGNSQSSELKEMFKTFETGKPVIFNKK